MELERNVHVFKSDFFWEQSGEGRGRYDCKLFESCWKREMVCAAVKPRSPDRVTHRVPRVLFKTQRALVELDDQLCEKNVDRILQTAI